MSLSILRAPARLASRAKAPITSTNSTNDMNDLALRYLHPNDDAHVLQIGIGRGALLDDLLHRVVRGHVVGIEPSAPAVDSAMSRFRGSLGNGHLDLRLGNVTALPLEEASFDAAITVATLREWASVDVGLAAIAHVLRPGARLVIAVPASSADAIVYTVETEEGALTTDELAGRLTAAGFAIDHQLLRRLRGGTAFILSATRR